MDRAKAQKKLAEQNKGKKKDGVSHTKRAESYVFCRGLLDQFISFRRLRHFFLIYLFACVCVLG